MEIIRPMQLEVKPGVAIWHKQPEQDPSWLKERYEVSYVRKVCFE